MADDEITISYDGGDADNHSIDMRLLGESLQGIEKIISELMIAVSQRRLPKKGERAPLVVKAREPAIGSVQIPFLLQESVGYLQLGWQIFGPDCSEIISKWFRAVINFHGGKRLESEQHMTRVAELAVAHSEALKEVEDHRHAEIMGMQNLLGQILERIGPSTVQAVAPVGPSVKRLWLFAGRQPRIAVEESDAIAIRAKADLEWSDLDEWTLRTDGFVFHTKRLAIEHPERSGWFSAEVNDPIAEVEANPYAYAAQRKAVIQVTAKAAHRAGELERLVISGFGGEIGDVA